MSNLNCRPRYQRPGLSLSQRAHQVNRRRSILSPKLLFHNVHLETRRETAVPVSRTFYVPEPAYEATRTVKLIAPLLFLRVDTKAESKTKVPTSRTTDILKASRENKKTVKFITPLLFHRSMRNSN